MNPRKISQLFSLLLLSIAGLQAAASSKPNIVFVLFDDMGYGQPTCYDPQSAFHTPNIDKIATEGMRFTDAHAAAAVCTPSRYALLTGRYPSRIGQFGVLSSADAPIIPTSRMTVATLLKQNGYATAIIGKWHLGLNWVRDAGGKRMPVGTTFADGPTKLGFEYFYGYPEARDIGTILEQDRVVAHVEDVAVEPLMIKKAVEWLGERAKSKQPFFLYFPACPPHTPIVPAPEYIGQGGTDVVKNEKGYADWLFQGDAMLGQLMTALEKYGLADNTLVIVTSDNGAAAREYAPLRKAKRSIYEGGHRVPYIVRWPGKVKPGSVNDDVVSLTDFMATTAEIVGAKLPDNAGEDSVSILSSYLGTATKPSREAVMAQSLVGNTRSLFGDLMICQDYWKLVCLVDGPRELYNLTKDLGEKQNVISADPEIATRLAGLMEKYIKEGRSTAGSLQQNDFALKIPDGKGQSKGKKEDE